MSYWQQIRIKNERDGGELVTWAEQGLCKVNKRVSLDDDAGKDVYKVIAVYEHRKTEDQVISDARDYKRTRKASDI